MRILIVDDEPGVRDVCARALARDGHEVCACVSGDEAVGRLSEPWDLIVTDVAMPGRVDGNELARRARAAGSADVALMTGFPTLPSSIEAVKAGACDYLVKPFAPQDLIDLARRCGSGRHPLAPEAGIMQPRELRTATILFADVRGFSSFAQRASPEEAAFQLDAMLSCLIEAVHAEGGTVNTFIGDGAMALFGLPLPHSDPIMGAARAALRARDAVESFGSLRFGFGINAGEVAAGSLGTVERSQYTVIGGAVNIAARLQETARPGEILMGPKAAIRIGAALRLGPPRECRFKGLDEPVQVRELLGT